MPVSIPTSRLKMSPVALNNRFLYNTERPGFACHLLVDERTLACQFWRIAERWRAMDFVLGVHKGSHTDGMLMLWLQLHRTQFNAVAMELQSHLRGQANRAIYMWNLRTKNKWIQIFLSIVLSRCISFTRKLRIAKSNRPLTIFYHTILPLSYRPIVIY